MSSPSPRRLTIAKAMSEALAQALERDPSVLVMGEDIARLGGVFGTTQGLLAAFGPERVRDTPISETGFIGAAVGLAAAGMRPVVELMFVPWSVTSSASGCLFFFRCIPALGTTCASAASTSRQTAS